MSGAGHAHLRELDDAVARGGVAINVVQRGLGVCSGPCQDQEKSQCRMFVQGHGNASFVLWSATR